MNYFNIVDSPKVKTSEIIKQMREKFDVWIRDEDSIDKEFLPPIKETVRYFEKNIEADEKYKDISANDLPKDVEFITLRERLIMELDYFNETGDHLDSENVTLCSGSRHSGGGVPSVSWNSDGCRVRVEYYHPSSSYPNLRARAVVSVPLSLDTSTIESRVKALEDDMEKIKKFLII